MGSRIAAYDWADSSLGPVESWPVGLRLAVDFVLDSLHPCYVAWGDRLLSIYNDGFVPILGDKHPAALGQPFEDVWREIWDEYAPIVAATLDGESHYFVDRPIALGGRAGKPVSWFTFSWTPLRADDGSVAGFMSVATETTEKVLAERALRESEQERLRRSEERYRQLFDSIDQGFCLIQMIFDDAGRPTDYRFLQVNQAFEKQTGLVDAVGRTMRSFAPAHEAHWFETYGRIALTGEPLRFELPAAELQRYFEVYAFRIGTPDERCVGILFNDITARKRAEEHQNLLLSELDHRVKNVLAVVQAIVRQSLKGSDADADGAARLSGRLAALARSHRLLADSRWEGAILAHLLAETVAPHRSGDPGRVMLSGPDLQVTPQAAQSLTLAFHELATNAVKYGALSTSEGRVSVAWTLAGSPVDRHLLIQWCETGGPPVAGPPTRTGFGTWLVTTTLQYELDGEVDQDFAPSGLTVRMRLPLGTLVDELSAQSSPSSPSRPRYEPDPARSLEGRRILVAEDQYLVAEELSAAIGDARGTVIGPMPTLAAALEAAEREAIDAASLDVNLNGEMVWPVATALRQRGIPVVFVTGYAASMAIPKELEALPRIEKPLDARRVVSCLASLIGRD